MQTLNKGFDSLPTLACIVFGCLPINQASGQPSPKVDLAARNIVVESRKLTLAEALGAVSIQTGLNIVADDVPQLAFAEMELRGTAKQALDIIAARFDYT